MFEWEGGGDLRKAKTGEEEICTVQVIIEGGIPSQLK